MTECRILKYNIPVQDEYELELPVSSSILSVAEQQNKIVVYALVVVTDEKMSKKKVKFLVKGTGHIIEDPVGVEYKFLGTVNLYDGRLMFHVFYQK